MRKSGSRASKMSTDGQDFSENPFPGTSDSEWQEFLEKEDGDLFILGLREEIVQKCMEICLKNYLEKQAVGFTVHCAYLAFCKVIDMYYMFRDPGDTDDPEVKDSWEPDPEPPPSIIDSWGVECIETAEPEPEDEKTKETRISKTQIRLPECLPESLESCTFMSDLFEPEEGGYYFLPEFFTASSSSRITRERSIFTRTLSMSRESLPLIKPLFGCQGRDTEKKKKKQ